MKISRLPSVAIVLAFIIIMCLMMTVVLGCQRPSVNKKFE